MSKQKQNDQENLLWEFYRQDIKPLKKKNLIEKKIDNKPEEKKLLKLKQEPLMGQKKPRQLSYLELGDRKEVDKNLGKKLVKGKLLLDGTLDLHGMTQGEALDYLSIFLKKQAFQGKRCVLIIAGKGNFTKSGKGILNQKVPEWLNLPDIRPLVLSFSYAQNRHGGTGAFYVLLKRKKS
ncbi:MAG: Smr/MutS family protein [Alphaproteobacteria bacterium]|nr:Smr/MutS family protein [Alphaproteobacteria bacterium]